MSARPAPHPDDSPSVLPGPECDHEPRIGGACLPCAADYWQAHAERLHALVTHLSRPGLCGNVPPRLVPSCQPQTSCTLRAGHAGFHEDDSGASWGQTWNDSEEPQ